MYFITSISNESHRCVGYVSTLPTAIDIVEHNEYDLWEAGTYPYIVIENIKEGIYQYDKNPIWYKYNKEKSIYEQAQRPMFIPKGFVGIAIG